MFLKIHHAPDGSTVVAVCDRELLNRRLRHGEIEIHVNEYFYGNAIANEEAVSDAINNGDNINLLGERAVSVAIGLGLVTRSGCIVIDGVPHAQIVRV